MFHNLPGNRKGPPTMQKRWPFCALGNVEISRDTNKERKMPKETTHRNPETRAARIERRAKKRADTATRKKIMKMMKARALEGA